MLYFFRSLTLYNSNISSETGNHLTLYGHMKVNIPSKRCVVIHVKCDPNRLRGYGAVGGQKWPFPITLASGLYNSLYYRTSRDGVRAINQT